MIYGMVHTPQINLPLQLVVTLPIGKIKYERQPDGNRIIQRLCFRLRVTEANGSQQNRGLDGRYRDIRQV